MVAVDAGSHFEEPDVSAPIRSCIHHPGILTPEGRVAISHIIEFVEGRDTVCTATESNQAEARSEVISQAQ